MIIRIESEYTLVYSPVTGLDCLHVAYHGRMVAYLY